MPVQINISGENAAQAIEEFAILSSAFVGPSAPAAVEEKPKRQRNTAPVKEDKPAKQEDSEPEPEQQEDNTADNDVGIDDEDIPSAADLRAKAVSLGKDAQPKIKALLDKFEAKNITSLPEDQRSAFMKALKGLE